jgi:oligopeptide/dipeptide ABC transporter ATP-binding protein
MMPASPPLLEAVEVSRSFALRGGWWRRPQNLRAVDRVSVALAPRETVALVGESGSGKSTLGRMLLGLLAPSAGEVRFEGQTLGALRGQSWRRFRRAVGVVFQDTASSLNPRRTVGESVEVPLRYNLGLARAAARDRADRLLDRVGLAPGTFRERLPHELSGGQRQRVGIARALASEPRALIADEPVSALDVSVRAQVLASLREVQAEDGLACLFITHDLGVVRAIADRVLVMYLGAVVEAGAAGDVLATPRHPYTQALLAAAPVPDPARRRAREALRGDPPSPLDPPSGCRFRTRCPMAEEICRTVPPARRRGDHMAACHFA